MFNVKAKTANEFKSIELGKALVLSLVRNVERLNLERLNGLFSPIEPGAVDVDRLARNVPVLVAGEK